MRSSFFASIDAVEFHTVEAQSRFGLTRVTYNINTMSIEEKEQVMDLITPYIRTDCKKM